MSERVQDFVRRTAVLDQRPDNQLCDGCVALLELLEQEWTMLFRPRLPHDVGAAAHVGLAEFACVEIG